MIQNKFRCLRPISATEQQTCSGVGALRPHPPPVRSRVPRNLPNRRSGCSVCGSIPVLDNPPPKRIPFGMTTDNRWSGLWSQLERHPRVLLPPLIQQEKSKQKESHERVWQEQIKRKEKEREERRRREDNELSCLQTAEAEALRLKMAIRDNDTGLRKLNERIRELQIEIKNLQETLNTFDDFESDLMKHVPRKLKKSIKWNIQVTQTGHPEDTVLLKSIKEQLDSIAEHQKNISKDIMSRKEELERVKLQIKTIVYKSDEDSKSLKDINLRIRHSQNALRKCQMELVRQVRKSVY